MILNVLIVFLGLIPSSKGGKTNLRRAAGRAAVAQSKSPTAFPTALPSKIPTLKPTSLPTKLPTAKPTQLPTKLPTQKPSKLPTQLPTSKPTLVPTAVPTRKPSLQPTRKPSRQPTTLPTRKPTLPPTHGPTQKPTAKPTPRPTSRPTPAPTRQPSQLPTSKPSRQPTILPTKPPTPKPSLRPTSTKPTLSTTNKPTSPTDSSSGVTSPTLTPETFAPYEVIIDGPGFLRSPPPTSSPSSQSKIAFASSSLPDSVTPTQSPTPTDSTSGVWSATLTPETVAPYEVIVDGPGFLRSPPPTSSPSNQSKIASASGGLPDSLTPTQSPTPTDSRSGVTSPTLTPETVAPYEVIVDGPGFLRLPPPTSSPSSQSKIASTSGVLPDSVTPTPSPSAQRSTWAPTGGVQILSGFAPTPSPSAQLSTWAPTGGVQVTFGFAPSSSPAPSRK